MEETKKKRHRRTKKEMEEARRHAAEKLASKEETPNEPKYSKLHFKERCDICGESCEDVVGFYDKNGNAHVICHECISTIKCL